MMSGRRRRRNLVRRGRVWYFERIVGGRRVRRSLDTSNLDEAIARRDALERNLALRRFPASGSVPTFGAAAREALAAMDVRRDSGAETGYAATTALDRQRALREEGPIVPHLGHLRLDAIDAAVLRRWHDLEIIEKGRASKTGDNLLDAIEQVFRFARSRGYLERAHKPVEDLREQLRAERRTKRFRAAQDRHRRLAREGVLSPEEIGRLVAAAKAESATALVVVLLAVECGLRRGESAGLRWGDGVFGEGPDDPMRAVEVRTARPRGEELEAPKSGRTRRPHISRRLWHALNALRRERWKPAADALVVRTDYFDLSGWLLRRVLERAGLPHRTFQNLRATCSSLLKQWGVNPEYVRAAIGHENEAVAREHYDRFDFTTYRPPETQCEGETPMDLFARLCRSESPLRLPSRSKKAPRIRRVGWCSQRESNPCFGLERATS